MDPDTVVQGTNDFEKDLLHLAPTVALNIIEGAEKTKSLSVGRIHKVPEFLRKLNESAYTPRLIAIGPLHRNDKHLQTPLQHVKMGYTNYLLHRVSAGTGDQTNSFMVLLLECLAEMKKSIGDVRKWYAAEVSIDEEMILVDGCFIIEFFYRSFDTDAIVTGQFKEDPIFGIPQLLTIQNITYDLLLLENQIPFFILEKLFQLTVARIPNRPKKNWFLSNYVWECYRTMLNQVEGSSLSDYILKVSGSGQESSPTAAVVHDANYQYHHILHILHDAYCPPGPRKEVSPSDFLEASTMPSASDLDYAGVQFVPGVASSLFKVKFTKPKGLFLLFQRARFEIPPLKIGDPTELILRNLIAFEQLYSRTSPHFSCYAALMDMLVNSDKDVEVLEKAGVVKNYCSSSKDATDLFNKLDKEIIVVPEYFGNMYNEATKYSKLFWPKNMAYLRRTYFESPWTFIAFCAGFIAFGISVLQFARDLRKKD